MAGSARMWGRENSRVEVNDGVKPQGYHKIRDSQGYKEDK